MGSLPICIYNFVYFATTKEKLLQGQEYLLIITDFYVMFGCTLKIVALWINPMTFRSTKVVCTLQKVVLSNQYFYKQFKLILLVSEKIEIRNYPDPKIQIHWPILKPRSSIRFSDTESIIRFSNSEKILLLEHFIYVQSYMCIYLLNLYEHASASFALYMFNRKTKNIVKFELSTCNFFLRKIQNFSVMFEEGIEVIL